MSEEKVSRRRYVKYIGGAAVAVAAVLGGYSVWQLYQPGKKEVEVEQQWVSCPEADMAEISATLWNEKYSEKTGIEMKTTILSFQGYFDKLAAQMVAENPKPDIYEMWSYYTGMHAPYMEPLNDYFEDSELFCSPDGEPYKIEDMDPNAIEAGSYKGKIYNLWHSNVHLVQMYRKDLIPTPAETWDEFLDLARQNTKSANPKSETKYGLVLCGRPEVGATWKTWVNVYWTYGGQYFKPGTFEPDFNSEAGLKAAELYYTFAEEKVFPPDVPSWAFLESMAAQQSGEVAQMLNWQPVYVTLIDSNESPLVHDKIAMDCSPGVKQPDGTILKVPYRGGNVAGINASSKNKREAFKFLAWYMFGEGMWNDVENGNTPGNIRPYQDPATVEKYPWIAEVARMELFKYGRAEPAYEVLPTIQAHGVAAVSSLLSMSITPEEFVERLQKEAVQTLEEAGLL